MSGPDSGVLLALGLVTFRLEEGEDEGVGDFVCPFEVGFFFGSVAVGCVFCGEGLTTVAAVS